MYYYDDYLSVFIVCPRITITKSKRLVITSSVYIVVLLGFCFKWNNYFQNRLWNKRTTVKSIMYATCKVCTNAWIIISSRHSTKIDNCVNSIPILFVHTIRHKYNYNTNIVDKIYSNLFRCWRYTFVDQSKRMDTKEQL